MGGYFLDVESWLALFGECLKICQPNVRIPRVCLRRFDQFSPKKMPLERFWGPYQTMGK